MIFRREPPPSRLVEDVVLALVLGSFSLVRPPAGAGRRRTAHRAAAAVLAGVYGGRSIRDLVVPRGVPVALGLAAAATTRAVADTTESWDRRSDAALVRAGVAHPRAVFAALVTGGLLAVAVLEERSRSRGWATGCTPQAPVVHGPLDAAVVRVVADVLSGYEGSSAPALRRQLALASQVRRVPDEAPSSWVEFSVPDDAPRAFPGEFRFPVSARSVSSTGIALTTRLLVVDGVLSSFEIVPADPLDPTAWEHPLPSCAELGDRTLVLDDATGTDPGW